MRPAEFTPEAIIQAGQELQAAGRNITGFALRNKVGGGAPNRLRSVWEEFVASKSVTQPEPVADLPMEVAEQLAVVTSALSERLSTLAIDLNDKAVKAAERRVADLVKAAGLQREQADHELADAALTVDDLESKLDQAILTNEQVTQKLSEAQNLGQAQAVELAKLQERLLAAEDTTVRAAGLHTKEIQRLESDHTQKIAALAELQNRELARKDDDALSAQKLCNANAERLASELQTAKEFAAAVAMDRDLVREQLVIAKAAAAAAAEALQQNRDDNDKRLEKAKSIRDAAQNEASAAKQDAARLLGQIEVLTTQNAELKNELSSISPPVALQVAQPPLPNTKAPKK